LPAADVARHHLLRQGDGRGSVSDGGGLAGAGCPQLTLLSLYHCDEVTDAGVSAVGAGCPQVTSLHLSGCKKVTDVGVSAVGAGCPQLTSLFLFGCEQVTHASVAPLWERGYSVHVTNISFSM
jgi:EIN3-binding F-box protein